MTTISVIGDIIVDEYIHGECERISPEAPVPVVKFLGRDTKSGGARNVFENIHSLTDDVKLCTSTLNPPRKTRVIANGHYLLRIDHEEQDCKWLTKPSFKEADVIVVSDYNKGSIPSYADLKLDGLKVIVDPKQSLSFYKGAWCIKPNRKEFEQFAGKWESYSDLQGKMVDAKNMCNFTHLIVTLGEDGVAYLDPENKFYLILAEDREVFDVTGAGDTFTAVLAYAVAQQYEMLDAIRLANKAAGIAVCHHGTYIITKEDLGIDKKETVVFTNGCFDVLHPGHLMYLQESKKLGNKLIVAVNGDESIKRLKGASRPINPLKDRIAMLSALPFVDAVVTFDEDTPINLIKELKPDIITKGGDYRTEDVVGHEYAKVVIIPFLSGYSSSKIIERIKNET